MEQRAISEELEEYARVLDFLPTGKSSSLRSEPIAQLVGESRFTLLEVVTKTKDIKVGERVYIGRGERDKVMQIKARINYEDLTESAKGQLPIEVANIIKHDEQRFVRLFNTAGPISIRLHALELFPGVGKKHLEAIIAAREEKPFESFDDLSKRVPPIQDPVKLLVARVIEELKGGSRFYILTRPYKA
ncbi:MAG: DUF655 domain-containing protein [Candidatus Micrarchaeaceae archaeon]